MTEPTYGQQAVGMTFAPAGDGWAQKVKSHYAEIIDVLHNGREHGLMHGRSREVLQRFADAETAAQTSLRAAMKALEWDGDEPERAADTRDEADHGA